MHLEIPEQLNCPICMSLFKIPITTECGHSFCRSCLINSSKNRKACPICRNQFQSSPDKLKQDDTLSRILDDFVVDSMMHNKKKQKKQESVFETKSESMLLLEVKTDQLLLPYNRIAATFELQNHFLLSKYEKIVARQQEPFNSNSTIIKEFGVISRISNLSKLRPNLYQCTFEGKAFCTIDEVTLVKKTQEQAPFPDEQFTYRTCLVKQILQTCSVSLNELSPFLAKLKEIKDPSILSNLYSQVDYNIFLHANDPLALIYSIFEMIDIENIEKYKVLTLFDEEKRMEIIRKVIAKNKDKDLSSNISGFVKIKKQTDNGYASLIVFLIAFLILLVVNNQENS